MFILNPQSGTPIYRQIIEQVQRMVASGQLPAGSELPSVRELASQHALNPMTISKAYTLLEQEGLLVRQRGKPMQIAALPSSKAREERFSLLAPAIKQVVLMARQLDISEREVLALIKQEFQF